MVSGKKFVRAVSQKLVKGCRCALSWCGLDLTFDLVAVNFSFKILSGLYLGNHKV